MIAILLFSIACVGQETVHRVAPGSKSNLISLEVINRFPVSIAGLIVRVTSSPDWVEVTGVTAARSLAANSRGESAISFDVLPTARSNDAGNVVIGISSNGKPVAQRTISLMVAPPTTYKLSQNYPNPFNPTTTIEYQLPVDGRVTLKVYDLLGQELATLVNEVQQADYYRVEFDGRSLASGVYFYRLQAGPFGAAKRLMLLR